MDVNKEETKDKEDKLRFIPKFEEIKCSCGNCNDHLNFGYLITLAGLGRGIITFSKN